MDMKADAPNSPTDNEVLEQYEYQDMYSNHTATRTPQRKIRERKARWFAEDFKSSIIFYVRF